MAGILGGGTAGRSGHCLRRREVPCSRPLTRMPRRRRPRPRRRRSQSRRRFAFVRRHKALVALFALLLMPTLALGGWVLYLNHQVGEISRFEVDLDRPGRPVRPAGDAMTFLFVGVERGPGGRLVREHNEAGDLDCRLLPQRRDHVGPPRGGSEDRPGRPDPPRLLGPDPGLWEEQDQRRILVRRAGADGEDPLAATPRASTSTTSSWWTSPASPRPARSSTACR